MKILRDEEIAELLRSEKVRDFVLSHVQEENDDEVKEKSGNAEIVSVMEKRNEIALKSLALIHKQNQLMKELLKGQNNGVETILEHQSKILEKLVGEFNKKKVRKLRLTPIRGVDKLVEYVEIEVIE